MTVKSYDFDLSDQFVTFFPEMKGRYVVHCVDQSDGTILVVETSTGDTRLIAARELNEMLASELAVQVKRHRPSKLFYEPIEREAARREFFVRNSIQHGAGSVLSKRSCSVGNSAGDVGKRVSYIQLPKDEDGNIRMGELYELLINELQVAGTASPMAAKHPIRRSWSSLKDRMLTSA